MNIFISVIIIFVLIYLGLNWFARTSSKKIAKLIRYIIIFASLILAIVFFLVGRYAFTIPVLFLLLPLIKLKGLTFLQLFQLYRLCKDVSLKDFFDDIVLITVEKKID